VAKKVLIEARGVSKTFRQGLDLPWPGLGRPATRALEEVSFSLMAGQSLGLVGQSGSGKTTLGMIISGLLRPSRGQVLFRDKDLAAFSGRELKKWRRRVQVIFQDPFSALNPRLTILRNLVEPLRIHRLSARSEERGRVVEALAAAGLEHPAEVLERLPRQLSGGQLQRAALARSLILEPQLLIADEPVSMLDASLRAAFLSQLQRSRREENLSLLYITHNLVEVAAIADRILVLYQGRSMEEGPTQGVLSQPRHPYTRELLKAVPRIIPSGPPVVDFRERAEGPGEVEGCPFWPGCPDMGPECRLTAPSPRPVAPGHFAACWKV